jgi:NAD(P)H-dependent FMN reductase
MSMKILALSGSLRATSSNNILLTIISRMMPPGILFTVYGGIGSLPHFDDSPTIPPAVHAFQQALKEADGVLICTPEYAFGVPGSLKNALDWTVGSGDFVNKPVALITASSVGDKAHAALQHTLTAISARLDEETTLLIPFIRAKLNDGRITDETTKTRLQQLIDSFVRLIADPG